MNIEDPEVKAYRDGLAKRREEIRYFAKIATTMAMAVSAALGASVSYETLKRIFVQSENKQITLEERINKLTGSLLDASKSIDDIETEIAQRRSIAERLKQDAEQAQKLKDINAEQVAAIAQTLRGELRQESNSSYWSSIWTNVFFAFLGALFGEGIRYARAFFKRSKPAAPNQT